MKLSTNIFISLMLLTLVVGYDVAHKPTPVAMASDVVASPVASPSASREVSYSPVEEYIRLKFGVWGDKAMTLLTTCENRYLNTTATNWNRNGTWDYGLFQINQVHGYTQEQLADYKFNTDVAWKLFVRAGYKFTDWTCAYAIGETPFYLK
jgi:hypothetical protein